MTPHGPRRTAVHTEPFGMADLLAMQPVRSGHDWGDTLYPLAGDTVVTPDGHIGCAMHTCPGRPLLPPGGQHRYVQIDDGRTLAWHISQLRPFEVATEVN